MFENLNDKKKHRPIYYLGDIVKTADNKKTSQKEIQQIGHTKI